MKALKNILTATVAAFALSSAADAAVYTIDSAVTGGAASGTIETDGALGVLTEANIVDWTIAMSEGGESFTLLGDGNPADNSDVLITGTAFTAVGDDLLFDFSASSGLALFQNPGIGSGENYFCFETVSCTPLGENGVATRVGDSGGVFESQVGNIVVASLAVAAVPLPASLPLLLAALGGVALLRRKGR